MNIQTGRDFLNSQLTPKLPDGWKVIPYDSNLDALDAPTVMYRVQSLRKHPAAPTSTYQAVWVLTVISPLTDASRRDDDADDLVVDLLDGLTAARIPWTTAEKAAWGKQYICYDVEIQLPTTRNPTQKVS